MPLARASQTQAAVLYTRSRVVLAAVVLLLAAATVTSCGAEGDELAILEVLVAEGDAECEDGECTDADGEPLEASRILARAVESADASRFDPEGLFVLATWEREGLWVELELDLPLDREGRVDVPLRYDEHREGEPVFVASDARGRIVLVAAPGGEMPYAAYLELRLESDEGEVRRLHLGHLEPDDGALPDPGPLEATIDWGEPGVELVILVAETAPSRQPPRYPERYYDSDYRLDVDPYVVAGWGCSLEEDDGCEGDEDYYPEETYDGGCDGDDWDAACAADDDAYYDDGGCEIGDLCAGDDYSDDYYYDDSSGACAGDDSSGSSDLACEGDDYSGGESFDCGKAFEGCEGDMTASAATRHRRALLARARGVHPPSPVRRAASMSPIVLALLFTRLLRRG